MDAGVGNAIDKFTRHVGWDHPGGPKVETAAWRYAEGNDGPGDLLDLPYVVKGMDFSFSGISSAANDAYDDGVPVEEICFSLQEHVFAMLTEVSERALSLTGADELVLGGGVAQNDRLREMLASMCAARGARFHAPDSRFLRDNAGMIAVLGAKMVQVGDTVPISESAIDPNFRPDQVPVTWRSGESVARGRAPGGDDGTDADRRGAEATVEIASSGGSDAADRRVIKRRVPKEYRHPELDRTLRRDRTVAEARLTSEARRAGVTTPLVYDADVPNATLTLQYVGDRDLAAALGEGTERVAAVGRYLARLHDAGIVHGDPTTRNVRVRVGVGGAGRETGNGEANGTTVVDDRTALIDFGLAYHTGHVEDHAMDLHVFEGSVRATATDPDPLIEAFEAGYATVGDDDVLDRLRDVEGRGRYR
jgi:N6-L-threonylcarbamoyladenine synthase/protein kinase Bud32